MADAGGSVVAFDIRTPCSDGVLVEQVRQSLARKLPELPWFSEPRPETLRIVANGPSARQAPLDGPTAALNGALGLFTAQGLAPTYWLACDPQELVVEFLKDPPRETRYLVASKCHPAVFDALKDRNVTIWHLDDEPTWSLVYNRRPARISVSITLVAPEPLSRLGWGRFETWGWDGCFMDGEGHAVAQPERPDMIEVEVGSQTFISTPSWALEAQDAVHKMAAFPFPITVHGGGMISEALRRHVSPDNRNVRVAP